MEDRLGSYSYHLYRIQLALACRIIRTSKLRCVSSEEVAAELQRRYLKIAKESRCSNDGATPVSDSLCVQQDAHCSSTKPVSDASVDPLAFTEMTNQRLFESSPPLSQSCTISQSGSTVGDPSELDDTIEPCFPSSEHGVSPPLQPVDTVGSPEILPLSTTTNTFKNAGKAIPCLDSLLDESITNGFDDTHVVPVMPLDSAVKCDAPLQNGCNKLTSLKLAFERLTSFLCESNQSARSMKNYQKVERFVDVVLPEYNRALVECDTELEEDELGTLVIEVLKETLSRWLIRPGIGLNRFSRYWQQSLSVLRRIIDLLSDRQLLFQLNYTIYSIATKYCIYLGSKEVNPEKVVFSLEQLNLLSSDVTNRLRQCSY